VLIVVFVIIGVCVFVDSIQKLLDGEVGLLVCPRRRVVKHLRVLENLAGWSVALQWI
jgi:hypothetical protein